MNNIINFQTARHVARQTLAKGKTLCRSGFHKWQVQKEGRFEVKQGKLLTTERCARCDATRAHHDGSTLKQAALALGYVTEQDFERWVRPADMVRPKNT